MMQRVVSHIVAHVSDEEETPENGEADGIGDWDEFGHESASD